MMVTRVISVYSLMIFVSPSHVYLIKPSYTFYNLINYGLAHVLFNLRVDSDYIFIVFCLAIRYGLEAACFM